MPVEKLSRFVPALQEVSGVTMIYLAVINGDESNGSVRFTSLEKHLGTPVILEKQRGREAPRFAARNSVQHGIHSVQNSVQHGREHFSRRPDSIE